MKAMISTVILLLTVISINAQTVFETDAVIGQLPSLLSNKNGVHCSFDKEDDEKLHVRFFTTGTPKEGGALKFELAITCDGDRDTADIEYNIIGLYDVVRGGLTLESLSLIN